MQLLLGSIRGTCDDESSTLDETLGQTLDWQSSRLNITLDRAVMDLWGW